MGQLQVYRGTGKGQSLNRQCSFAEFERLATGAADEAIHQIRGGDHN